MSNYEKKLKLHIVPMKERQQKIFIQKIIIMITALNVGAYQ